MRITLITSGSSYPLAGQWPLNEREFSGAVDFRISAEHVAEKIERVRAPLAKMFHRGNLSTTVSFSTRRVFANHAEALLYAADLDAETPRTGEVMFATGAGARHLQDAVVSPPTHEVDGCAVRMDYVATGTAIAKKLPLAVISSPPGGGLTVSPGGGGTMQEELEDARGDGLVHRIVNDGAEKWFEVGFLSPTNTLLGDAANGWMDPGGNLLFRFERSENLTTWDHDFIAAPSTPVNMGDGDWMYYARMKYPMDSAVKTGQLWAESPTAQGFQDTRNNPFTALTVNNVVRALGGFPYTMPGDAARMQADMIANGLTGATVVASSATVWRIDIPNVYQTAYQALSKVFWPQYLVEDMFGVVNTPVNGMEFSGQFVNAAGVRTAVAKQFARLGVSAGPNNRF